MAIFRRTNTTRERLKAIFSKGWIEPHESRKWFASLHPDPMTTTVIDTEIIGGMVQFIRDDLHMTSYDCENLFYMSIDKSSCTISYAPKYLEKAINIKIWNVDSNFVTIEVRVGDDYLPSIEQCPIANWRQQIIKIIMDCLSDVIDSQYQIRYRNIRKKLF